MRREGTSGRTIWHPELSVFGKGCKIGEETVIHAPVWIGDKVSIGRRCKVQAFAFIPEGVTIGDDCFIGPHVVFTNDPKMTAKGRKHWKKTVVKKGAKIGANASILAGVTIGERALVGMGAVVLTDVPARETWAGVPAHKIG